MRPGHFLGFAMPTITSLVEGILNLPMASGDTLWGVLARSLIWLAVVVVGGQLLITLYSVQRKKREQRIELARFIKQRQYEALQEMYTVFASFMQLFREINARHTNLKDPETSKTLFDRIVKTEAEVEATILRIACEFSGRDFPLLADMLGKFRQSSQIWRQSVQKGRRLPFDYSDQEDYKKFKESIASISAYLASEIFEKMEPMKVDRRRAAKILERAFDNRYEKPDFDIEAYDSALPTEGSVVGHGDKHQPRPRP